MLRSIVTVATPLLGFMRAMTREQQEAFAAAVGTTRVYLYQLAATEEPNPRLRLALAIAKESHRISKRLMAKPLDVEDLLVGTAKS